MKLAIFLVSIFALSALFVWFFFSPEKKNTSIEQPTSKSSHSLSTIKSNKWFSSIYKGIPTAPLYAQPLVYKFTDKGIQISYPKIVVEPNTIFSPFTSDIQIGIGQTISSLEPAQIGDWHIKVKASSQTENFLTTIGQGLPYTYLHSSTKNWQIDFETGYTTINKTNTSQTVMTNENLYLIVWDKSATLDESEHQIKISNSEKLFIAVLDDKEHENLFKQISEGAIESTQVSWTIDADTIKENFQIQQQAKSLIAILPHQYAGLVQTFPALGQYRSIRGPMTLIQTNKFQIKIFRITPPESFSIMDSPDSTLLNSFIQDSNELLNNPIPESKNYGLSVWMGKMANQIELANALRQEAEKKLLITRAGEALEAINEWYEYDSRQQSIVSKSPEFGNERLNDHHFHYGYVIRLAAILKRYGYQIPEATQLRINEIVQDIATNDRQSDRFPFVRNFDFYEGHSWADGYAQFADGQNQESSSEAINAWYGLYLWAKVNSDPETEKLAIFLFNSEIYSTKYYWFNIGNIYPKPYEHAIASLVWGGKVDFTTWFGNDTNFKYGIQILPVTPASGYLKTIPNFFNYEGDFLRSGGSYDRPWGELMQFWKSQSTREISLDMLPKQPETTPRSILEYFLLAE